MRIARDGSWYHEGQKIRREALVRLFASILRKDEDDQFYLVTPVEKYRVEVEETPFVATELEVLKTNGQQQLQFTTNLGDQVIADADHPIWVVERGGQPRPYVRVRAKLDALISRTLFYQLVELAEERKSDGKTGLFVCSSGERFLLGEL